MNPGDVVRLPGALAVLVTEAELYFDRAAGRTIRRYAGTNLTTGKTVRFTRADIADLVNHHLVGVDAYWWRK